jgi:hypothetical protein
VADALVIPAGNAGHCTSVGSGWGELVQVACLQECGPRFDCEERSCSFGREESLGVGQFDEDSIPGE